MINWTQQAVMPSAVFDHKIRTASALVAVRVHALRGSTGISLRAYPMIEQCDPPAPRHTEQTASKHGLDPTTTDERIAEVARKMATQVAELVAEAIR